MTNQRTESAASGASRLTYIDAVGMVLLTLLILVLSYVRSRHRMFWGDEIMGWLVLTQPNWHTLLHLWKGGIDSSGIWFYVLGRPWIAIFGASEVSLREFSAVGVAASAVVLWITGRRFYATLPVAAAISFVYASTPALSWQLANGRTYGVFLLANSLVIYLLLRGEDASAAPPSPRFLLATFAAYSFLAGSHILGFLYAGAFLAMQVGFDVYRRRFRPKLYLSAACCFVVVVFSRANLVATAALGKPTFWSIRPTFRSLLSLNIPFGHPVALAILLLLALLVWRSRPRIQRVPVYLLTFGFIALDLVIFAYSRVSTSLYVDRYMLPFSFLAVLLLCELFTQFKEMDTFLPRIRSVIPALFLLFAAAYFFVPRLQHSWFPFPDYTSRLLAALPPGLPVVDTDPGSFVDVQFYHHGSIGHAFLFPTDAQVTLDPSNTGGVSGFHEMDNFKTYGLYADEIEPTAQILDRYRDFAVIAAQPPTPWFKRRVLGDPHVSVVKLGSFEQDFTHLDIWIVHRK